MVAEPQHQNRGNKTATTELAVVESQQEIHSNKITTTE
jgi:hypothetical protein